HDHRMPPVQIDPNKLFSVILAHSGASYIELDITPPAFAGNPPGAGGPAPSSHQNTVMLDGDHASGVAYCLAHHVKVEGSAHTLMVAAIRYLDSFVKQDGAWFFSERKLMVDWTETRTLGTS